ncbi:hypothetical protein [Methylophaga sp.]|uniref:DUF7931 domain-containing protein n=1 Tax=Methylophaga sp. TaxID=2024840 RepID=UPI003F6A5080
MSDQIPTYVYPVTFDSRDQAAAIALDLIKQARHEICFFGPLIDPVLLDNEAVIEQLSEFARRSARTRIRIVVFDTRKNISQSHRLIPLAQRLTSKIEIHIASPKHQKSHSMFLLVDTEAYMHFPNAERYVGRAENQALAEVRDKQQNFDEIWNQSKQDINSRRLHI